MQPTTIWLIILIVLAVLQFLYGLVLTCIVVPLIVVIVMQQTAIKRAKAQVEAAKDAAEAYLDEADIDKFSIPELRRLINWYQMGDPSMHNEQDDAIAQKIDIRLNPIRYAPTPPAPPEPERSPSGRIKRKKKEDPNAPPEPSGLPPPEHKFLDFDLDSGT